MTVLARHGASDFCTAIAGEFGCYGAQHGHEQGRSMGLCSTAYTKTHFCMELRSVFFSSRSIFSLPGI